ncbi:MAG: ribokinase [Alphaproteobacteria bacterium]|nr:MAG: ribokinase [Alphaproteobacteria bacterium]
MIYVLGSINTDLVARTERMPSPGETVTGQSFATTSGGKGANQAIAAKMAGSAVALVGAVGDDAFAVAALAELTAASVDLSRVQTEPAATGTAIILVDASGQNMITVVPGANALATTDMARSSVAAMTAADILLLQMEIPADTVEIALELSRDNGIVTILNIAPFAAETARLASLANIIVANESEFELLAGRTIDTHTERISALKTLYGESGQTIVVTLGPDGVVAIHKNEILSAKGLTIVPVDTVGAGDTFCGYLAASLEQGTSFPQALRRAAVAGSLACLKHGAQTSMPAASSVDATLLTEDDRISAHIAMG